MPKQVGTDYSTVVDHDDDSSISTKRDNEGARRGRVQSVHLGDAKAMALHVIRAEKFRAQPYSSEVLRAKSRNISWRMDVHDDHVDVVRRNDAAYTSRGRRHVPTETHFVYRTPTDRAFRRLIRSVQHERNKLLRQPRQVNQGGCAGCVVYY